ncbi:MAG: SCP2 sterol-binding domain-containing protein [Candidatus Jordarchaeales archaeon]
MEELEQLLKKIEEIAAKNEDIQAEIEGWDRILQFNIEGAQPFYVQTKNGKLTIHQGTHQNPDLTFEASKETILAILKGELDATSAYMSGDLKITGPLPDAVKFRTILEIARDEL